MPRPNKRSKAMKESWERRRNNHSNPLHEDVTVVRHPTHGDFAKNAQISQDFKTIMRAAGCLELAPVQAEALDMIALKISRVLSGKATVKDHWVDIGGYAKLAEAVCD